jgi:hypothetical protein
LFSNTARAHDLGRTHDWVVIYFYDDDHRESQCTVVTETHGPMTGKRVVRGREAECRGMPPPGPRELTPRTRSRGTIRVNHEDHRDHDDDG